MIRVNSARWGPRAVDVDVLMYDDLVLENGETETERGRETTAAVDEMD